MFDGPLHPKIRVGASWESFGRCRHSPRRASMPMPMLKNTPFEPGSGGPTYKQATVSEFGTGSEQAMTSDGPSRRISGGRARNEEHTESHTMSISDHGQLGQPTNDE